MNEVSDAVLAGVISWPGGKPRAKAAAEAGTDAGSDAGANDPAPPHQDLSNAAVDLIGSLLTLAPTTRLGGGGALEVKSHGFFGAVSWTDLLQADAFYIPLQYHHAHGGDTSIRQRALRGGARNTHEPVESSALAQFPSPGQTGMPSFERSPLLEETTAGPTCLAAGVAAGEPWVEEEEEEGEAHAVGSGASGRPRTPMGSPGSLPFDASAYEGERGSILLAGSHLSELESSASFRKQGAPIEVEQRPAADQPLLNFDYTNVSNLSRINEEVEQNAGSEKNHEACKVCYWHLSHLGNEWTTDSDFDKSHTFHDVQLASGGTVDIPFRENLVRISQQRVPTAAAAAAAAAAASNAAASNAASNTASNAASNAAAGASPCQCNRGRAH